MNPDTNFDANDNPREFDLEPGEELDFEEEEAEPDHGDADDFGGEEDDELF